MNDNESDHTILIVDDSTTMLTHLRNTLAREGLKILQAADGLKGFQMLVAHRPTIMICDLQMPGISGLKLLELRAARPELAEIPIIMLTAEAEPETKVTVLDAGAADYVTKPFHEKELAARVRVHLRVRELADQLRVANQSLLELATTDELTGLLNRRSFDQRFAEEVTRSARYEIPLSLLFLDIDHFKNLNDTYGHLFGDEVLRRVGATVKSAVRATDLAARYGGEEFAVILPHTSLSGGLRTAERLRSEIAGLQPTFEGRPVAVTTSVGVACSSEGNVDGVKLVGWADEALYAAKDKGRNRVEQCLPRVESR